MNIYQQKLIKSILISKNYSFKGDAYNIKLNKEGISTSIESLISIKKISDPEFKIDTIKDYYCSFFNDLNEFNSVDSELLLGEIKIKEYNNYLKESLKSIINMTTDYHLFFYKERKKAYDNLNPVVFENKVLEIPQYNHKSVTGRTSIVKGHNFLTMKKIDRKKLKYHKEEYTLLEIDFKSCEPFFYINSRLEIKEEIKDVYQYISNMIDYNVENRDKFKRGVLSLMYGAEENTVSKISGIKRKDIIKIKEYLKLSELEKELNDIYLKNNHFFNFYGRPILKNNNLINYWIQSSAVDFCSLCFKDFIDEFKVKPCFLIHDSLTFAVENNRIDNLLQIKSLKDKYSNISIPVTIKKLSDS